MLARELAPMSPIREPVLRGHHTVAALWFPAAWFDEQARAARLIACWRPGATAWRFAQGDLLTFATAVDQDCDDLPGWPLVQEGNVVCSASLNEAERSIRREGDVWIVLGAEPLTLDKRGAEVLDPSEWLATDLLSLHDTYDCSVPLAAPEVLQLESRPLREVLGNAVPPASPEQADFLNAMRRARKQNSQPDPDHGSRNHRSGEEGARTFFFALVVVIALILLVVLLTSGAAQFRLWWVFALILLVRLVAAVSKRGVGVATQGRAAQPSRVLKQRAGLAHPQRWRRWLARIAMTTQLSRLLGRAHARHLRRVLGFFDEGNLKEALRHAIPLGGEGGSLGQSFGLPGRRDNLELSRAQGASTSIGLDDELLAHLRDIYRRAFQKLDHEQRFEEAVFVLAELLNARGEALDYLEQHKRFDLAAELALGWDMPPDVIVRLHCLAGDWRLAVAVARRDNAFANAIGQLEKRWPDAARKLREEWGNALVQQGEWIGAVEAVWPVESLRAKATEWLLAAEAAGGRLAMRALVQRAVLLPDTLDRYAKELTALQQDRSLWRERVDFAEALMNIGRTPATQQLAAAIAPALLADHAQDHRRFDRNTLERFVRDSGDVLLQVDAPRDGWPGFQPRPANMQTEALCVAPPQAGTHSIQDAVPLDDQRYLLALGESGACVVDARGRILARFATPAQRLVLAHSKQVALLLAKRKDVWRVGRLDLVQQTTTDLGVLAFDFWGTQFDGLHWTIAEGRRIRVLDTQESLRRVVWQVPDLPGQVQALTASRALEQIIVAGGEGPAELWSYRLPQRQLAARTDLVPAVGMVRLLNPQGGMLDIQVEETDGLLGLKWHVNSQGPQYHVEVSLRDSLRLWLSGGWLVVGSLKESDFVLHWFWAATAKECVRVRWPADAAPELRANGDDWLVYDERGRLLNVNVGNSQHHSFALR